MNLAPSLTGLRQVDAMGHALATGAAVNAGPTLQATVDDPEDDEVKLELEVVPSTGAFSGTNTHSGTLGAEGELALPLPTLEAGTYKWQARAVDSRGNASDWRAFEDGAGAFIFQVGELSGSLSIAGGAPYTNASTVDLIITATPSEGASLTQMRFSNDGSTFSASEPFASTKSGWVLASGDGQKTVQVEVSDSHDVSAIFTANIAVDTSAPVISGFVVNSGATATANQNVTLSFNANDTGSGIATRLASNDGVSFGPVAASPAAWALSGGDGTKQVTLKVIDAAGNEEVATASVVLDTSAPTITSAQINGGASWTRSAAAALSVVANDGTGSGATEICVSGGAVAQCQPFGTGSVNVTLTPGDGQKNVLVVVKDAAGNQSLPTSATISVDTVAPTLSSISINGGATLTNARTLSITSVASDGSGSGISTIAFETDSGGFGTPMPYASPVTFTLPAGDGTRIVGARIVDEAGNQSTVVTASIVLDETPPNGSVTINAGNPQFTNTTAVTLVLNATDATSTATHYCAKSSNAPPTSASDGCWTALASTGFTLSTGDGAKTVYVWFKDQADNFTTTPVTDQITLDATAPTVSVIGTGLGLKAGAALTNGTVVTFNNAATDATSGLAEVCVSATVNPPTSCLPYGAAPTVTLASGDGSKTAWIRVKDAAGNYSTVASDTIVLDQTAPSLSSVTINGGQLYAASSGVSVTTSAADANGIAAIELSNDGTQFGAPVPYAATVSHTLSTGDGTKTVYARVTDQAGNVSAQPFPSDTILLDTTAPGATISVTSGARYTQASPVSVTISASEAGSGVAKMCLKVGVNGGAAPAAPTSISDPCFIPYATPTDVTLTGDGDKRVHLWLLDNAGNISPTPSTCEIWLDATAPTTPGPSTVTTGHRQITLTWSNATDGSSGIARYEVGLSTTSGGPYNFGHTVQPGTGATTSTIVTVPNGTLYYLVVRAVDAAGNIGGNNAEATGAAHFPFAPQHRTPTASKLNAVVARSIATGTRYLLAGDEGALFSSDDSFGSYERLDPLTDGDLHAAYVHGSWTWIAGEGGYIGRSTDDGVNWSRIENSQPGDQADLYGFTYAGASGSLVQRSAYVAVGGGGTLLRWIGYSFNAPSFSPVASGTTNDLHAVARCVGGPSVCTGEGVLIAVGDAGTILRSVDLGETWTSIPLPSGYTPGSTHWVAVAAAPNSDTIWITGQPSPSSRSALIRSIDGGQTFQEVINPSFSNLIGSSVASVGTNLWWGGRTSSGTARLVKVSGISAQTTTVPYPPESIFGVDSTTLAAVADFGEVLHTIDGGLNWMSRSGGVTNSINDLSLPNGFTSTLWAVGSSGYVAYSGSAGNGWTQQATGVTNADLRSLATWNTTGFISGVLGFAVGTSGVILKTTNGTTWSLDPSSGVTSNPLNGVSCRSASACIAVGNNETVLQYSGSWTVVATGGTDHYNAVDTYLAGGTTARAIAVGSNGALRTLSGNTWTTGTPIASANLLGVAAKSDGNGTAIAVGEAGTLYKSVDHGLTWTAKNSGTPVNLRAIDHQAGTTIWYATGDSGIALKSTDDGESWYPLDTHTTRPLFSVATSTSLASPRVWLSGLGGTVLYSGTRGE